MKNKIIKPIITIIIITFLLVFNGVNSANAFDNSRFFTMLMLLSGVGSSFAGAITHGQADKIYDEYLHSAIQSDMNKSIDDYDKKHQQSVIATRTGIGLTIGAILISLIDASHIPQPAIQAGSFGLGSSRESNFYTNVDLNKKEFHLGINQSF
jgi:hypothetical protein